MMPSMNFPAMVGRQTIRFAQRYAFYAAVAFAVLRQGLRPSVWPRTTRNVLARQILFTGVEAIPFIALVGLLVGASVVLQAQVWLSRVGQSDLLGPLLIAVVVRELGPLLTNFVVIGRSGAAITTELGIMRVNGEVDLLDAQGLDPFLYLVLPRVLGVMVSVFCLALVFILVAMISGFLFAYLLGMTNLVPGLFFGDLLRALTPADMVNVLAKTLLPGMLVGIITTREGLSIDPVFTQVPQAVTRALMRSVAALFITSAVISVLTYI